MRRRRPAGEVVVLTRASIAVQDAGACFGCVVRIRTPHYTFCSCTHCCGRYRRRPAAPLSWAADERFTHPDDSTTRQSSFTGYLFSCTSGCCCSFSSYSACCSCCSYCLLLFSFLLLFLFSWSSCSCSLALMLVVVVVVVVLLLLLLLGCNVMLASSLGLRDARPCATSTSLLRRLTATSTSIPQLPRRPGRSSHGYRYP